MATFDFQSSLDRNRFVRFNRMLIAGGTPILREILKQYHTPASLVTALRSTRIGFTKPQKLLVNPPSGSPDFENFDISLIFKLLRNCCGLTEPTTKWNEMPVDSDTSLEADIVRIDYYRNKIYAHAREHMALTQNDFGQYWRIISDTLCRRAGGLPGMNVTALRNQIDELRFSPLTAEDHRRSEEAFRIESMLAEQNKVLDNIVAKEDQLKEGIEGLQDTMIDAFYRTRISDVKTPTVASPLTVHYHLTNVNHISPNISSDGAQDPQPFSVQGIRRQFSDGTIPYPSPQRPYKKSRSLPSNVSLLMPSSQERFGNSANPSLSQFQSTQTADVHRQMSDNLWQSPTPTAATFAPHRGLDRAPALSSIGQDQSLARSSHESSPNPERFLNKDSRPDCGNQVPRRHPWQSPTNTIVLPTPHGESSKASFMVGQRGLPDPEYEDQAAAQGTWTYPSNHEYPTQQTQQLGQEPLLHMKISVSHDLLGFRLSEFIKSALETSDEGTDVPQFTSYLERHQLVIKKIEGNPNGDLCFIGFCPQNLKSLEDFWRDFIHRDLEEFVKEILLPEDFEGDVHVDIDGEEYKRCCERLRPRVFKDSGRQLHSQSLSQLGMAGENVTEPFSPRTLSTRSQSVMDLSRPVTDAYQELFQLLCKNGGRMNWQDAIDQLPYSYRSEFAKPAFRQNMQKCKLELLDNNVVRAKVSLRFCPKMRKDSKCNDTNCPDLHLCRYHFLIEGCQFPMSCKNSHDISDHHTNNVFKVANLSFLNNEERKRLLDIVAYVVPEICFYYNTNRCTKGASCPYLHVCKDWVRRICVAGNVCTRAHTFMKHHEQNILQKKNLTQLSDIEILEKLRC